MLTALLITWGIIAIGWFHPKTFVFIGRFLISLGEGCEAGRRTIEGSQVRSSKAAKPVSPSVSPVQRDVIDALVAQGAKRPRAQVCVYKAVAMLGDASFEDLFRAAIAESSRV